MYDILKMLGKIMVWSILLLLSVIVLLAFVDLIYETYIEIIKPPLMVINSKSLIELFSLCLIIIIGIELIETVKAFLKEEIVHVELVILVAIIAIARKVIVWDFDKYSNLHLLSLAAMLLALASTYFLIKKSNTRVNIFKKNDFQDRKKVTKKKDSSKP